MIISALCAQYDRLLADGRIPDPAFVPAEVALVVRLDRGGRVTGWDSTGQVKGGLLRGRSFLVPPQPKGKTGLNPPARLLCERFDYVFGLPIKKEVEANKAKKPVDPVAKAAAAQGRFRAAIEALPPSVREDEGVAAVLAFLDNPDPGALRDTPEWQAMSDKGGQVTFRLDGDCDENGEPRLVCRRPAVVEWVRAACEDVEADTAGRAQCMVTGEVAPIARLHSTIKGVTGAKAAMLVSFNDDALESYDAEQGANAPISVAAEKKYTAALNWLLADPRHRFHANGVTYVFWSDREEALDAGVASVFGIDPDGAEAKQEPDPAVLREALASVVSGARPETANGRFYLLGLSANTTRVIVRMFHCGTVAEIAANLLRWFDDLAIAGLDRPLPLWKFMAALSLTGDAKKVPGPVAAEIVRAALLGGPLPNHLLAQCVTRMRRAVHRAKDDKNEQNNDKVRIRLIKAVVNRNARLRAANPKEAVSVSLDRSDAHPGYLLGRLFAVYENIQANANPGVSSGSIHTIWFDAAMQRPTVAFTRLRSLSGHHLRKMRQQKNDGLAATLEREIGEIYGLLEGTLPGSLSLDQQARFLVGYQHQRWHRSPKKQTSSADTDAAQTETTDRKAA